MKTLLLILFSTTILSACGFIETRREGWSRSAGVWDSLDEYRNDQRENEVQQAKSELGLQDSRSLNDTELYQLRSRIELKRLEKNLASREDRQQYYQSKPYFSSDRERAEFLQLPSYEARRRWLEIKNISSASSRFSPEISDAISNQDIVKGMTKNAVRESWGEPELIEVAGEPAYGNEYWQYRMNTSSTEGYKSEVRRVYFEGGQVAGWEKSF